MIRPLCSVSTRLHALALAVACGTPAELVEPVVNPLLDLDRSGEHAPFSGRVTEVRPAGGYLYVAVDDRWVVGLTRPLGVGDAVTVRPIGVARDFVSGRTGDRYDELVFGVVSKASP